MSRRRASERSADALDVELFPLSNIAHLRQVFAGFHALERRGLLRLRYRTDGPARFGIRPPNDFDRGSYCLPVEIRGHGTVVYDLHDSAVVVEPLLAQCDLYLKRSYSRALHGETPRIRPLGLNLWVENENPSLRAAWRAVRFGRSGRSRLADTLRALCISPPHTARPRDLAAFPVARADPQVLFLARAWNPDGFYNASADERRDRATMNAFRAACVRALRGAFGARFTGGLEPDAYACAQFPDALAEPNAVRRDRYLQGLRRFDVCVSTEGLLGSTGWKFAEYLALGRAVVAERMRFEATGALHEGTHYLGFATPDACVEAVGALMDDRARRQAMMSANASYYAGFVAPEALVFRSLTALLSAGAQSRCGEPEPGRIGGVGGLPMTRSDGPS